MRRALKIPALVAAGMVFLSGVVACTQHRPDSAIPMNTVGQLSPASSSTPTPTASSTVTHMSHNDLPTPHVAAAETANEQTNETTPVQPTGPTRTPKTAYLTFDDGPSASTERILEVLQRFDVKATFFVVGAPSENGRRLYKRIAEDGHTLGNHTFTHGYNVVYHSVDAFKRDVEKLSILLEQSTGKRPELLRFPGGSNNRQSRKFGGPRIMSSVVAEMTKEGYAYFDWNVSSTDAASRVQPRQEIVGAVLSAAKGKSNVIVLMHDADVKTTTVEALPEVIRGLREMGFRFDVLRKDSFTFQFLKP